MRYLRHARGREVQGHRVTSTDEGYKSTQTESRLNTDSRGTSVCVCGGSGGAED